MKYLDMFYNGNTQLQDKFDIRWNIVRKGLIQGIAKDDSKSHVNFMA